MSESEANPPELAEAMALPPLDDSSPPRARAAKRLVRSERETVETTVVDVAVAPSPYRKGRDEKSTTLAVPAPAKVVDFSSLPWMLGRGHHRNVHHSGLRPSPVQTVLSTLQRGPEGGSII